MHLIALFILLGVMLAGCSPKQRHVEYNLPLHFVEESSDKYIFEKIGNVRPIALEEILLIPVVEDGVINGVHVKNAIGSPVSYKPGSTLDGLVFRGIDRWGCRRYIAIARGFYLTEVPHAFFYTDVVSGVRCKLVEVTPLAVGADRDKYTEALVRELRSGAIDVGQDVDLLQSNDYSVIVRAATLTSWIVMPLTGHRKGLVAWGTPGKKVHVCFSEEDIRMVERYLKAP